MHGNYITLEVGKTSTGGVTVQLTLSGLEGMTIRVPDIFVKAMSREEYERFINEVFMALRGDFEETDGTIKHGKAAMTTTQVWQVIVWSLLYPSEVYILVDTINTNDGDVTVTYFLRSNRYKSIKGKILSDVTRLSEEGLLAFMLTAVVKKQLKNNGRVYSMAVIKITMSGEEFERWESLFEKLKKIGFRSSKPYTEGNVVEVPFYGGNAINLAGL